MITIQLTTHWRKRKWRWKPSFIKSNIIYGRDNKTYLAPLWELVLFGKLRFVWQGYSHEKEMPNKPYTYHECPADLMQERINFLEDRVSKLEAGIKYHEANMHFPMPTDKKLWELIK